MSDNKREMMKITIEAPDHEPHVIECHAFAGITMEDTGKSFNNGVTLIGSLNAAGLINIKQAIETELIPLIESNIKDFGSNISAGDFLRALAAMIEEDN